MSAKAHVERGRFGKQRRDQRSRPLAAIVDLQAPERLRADRAPRYFSRPGLCGCGMSRELGDLAVASIVEIDRLNAHLEMLRRVTRDMAVTSDLSVLLNSIASAIVEHTGAVMARVFLFQTEDECDVCRAQGASGSEKHLHLRADAGAFGSIVGLDHVVPIDAPVPPAKVARDRQPFLTNDLLRDASGPVQRNARSRYQ